MNLLIPESHAAPAGILAARHAACDARDRFAADGFLRAESVFSFDELAWLRHEAELAGRRASVGDPGRALHAPGSPFARLAAHPRLLNLARNVLGVAPAILGSRMWPRQPFAALASAGGDPAIRSQIAFPPPRSGVVVAVLLGEPGANPALRVVPGSHRAGTPARATLDLPGGLGDVLAYDPALDHGWVPAGEARALPAFLMTYGPASGNAEAGAAAVSPTPEPDDCLWPGAWCVAG